LPGIEQNQREAKELLAVSGRVSFPSCTIVASDAFAVPAAATEEISGLAAGVDPGQTGAAKGG